MVNSSQISTVADNYRTNTSYNFFYTAEVDGRPVLNHVMMFITAKFVAGDDEQFEIKFGEDGENQLLKADNCFNRVVLPIIHESYSDFRKACIISLTYGAQGYGKF